MRASSGRIRPGACGRPAGRIRPDACGPCGKIRPRSLRPPGGEAPCLWALARQLSSPAPWARFTMEKVGKSAKDLVEECAKRGAASLNLDAIGLETLRRRTSTVWGLSESSSSVRMGELPANLHVLTQLTALSARANNIGTLSKDLFRLTRLVELHLGDNILEALGGEIGMLRALSVLSLDGNRLPTLPKSISQLGSLGVLDVVDVLRSADGLLRPLR